MKKIELNIKYCSECSYIKTSGLMDTILCFCSKCGLKEYPPMGKYLCEIHSGIDSCLVEIPDWCPLKDTK